jgi:signal transduction histidine kinase
MTQLISTTSLIGAAIATHLIVAAPVMAQKFVLWRGSSHCTEIEKQHDAQVRFATEGDLRQIPPDVALCLFRIGQEALRNGIVHGHARQLAVSVARSGGHIELTVTDDGRGFDLDAVSRSGGGLGLVSMEERAHALGGNVDIVSRVGAGTTIRVRVPAVPGSASRQDDVVADGVAN